MTHGDFNPLAQARPGEMHRKQWLYEEAARNGVTWRAIERRVERGKYPHITFIRRAGTRCVFVKV